MNNDLAEYIVSFAQYTRNDQSLRLGYQQEASLVGSSFAKQMLLQGRSFIIPEDVISLASPALAHRIWFKESTDRQQREAYIHKVITKLALPR